MHQFKCKVVGGRLVPTSPMKQNMLKRMLSSYEAQGKIITLTLEEASKNISAEQQKLYKAFIVKAANHFGNDYHEMEQLLEIYKPDKPMQRWTSEDLDLFIHKSTALLGQYGFHF